MCSIDINRITFGLATRFGDDLTVCPAGQQLWLISKDIVEPWTVEGDDARMRLLGVRQFDGVPKKQAKIAHLQQGVDAWREKNAFELEGKDWVAHVGSQTIFMPTPAMGSRNCSAAWQCWTPPHTLEVPEGVVKISNEEWRRVRNVFVKDVWVWPADGADGVCRLLRLHELLAL